MSTPALSFGQHWWHPAHQCSRCSLTLPLSSPSAGTDGMRLVSFSYNTGSLPLSPSAGTDGMRLVSFFYNTGSLPLSPSAGTDGMRLVSFFYNTGSLPLSPSAGTDGMRLVSFFYNTGSLPLSPSAGTDSMRLASFFYNTQDLLIPVCSLSPSLIPSVLPFVPLSPHFYIHSHHCGQRCHCCPASTNPFVISTLEAASPLLPPHTHTLGWAHRCMLLRYIYIITFNFPTDWTPNIS